MSSGRFFFHGTSTPSSMATRIWMALMTEPGESREMTWADCPRMLGQFKQAGKTAFTHNEAVLEVDVKAAVEEECPVSVARLTVGMNRTLVGRLLKRLGVRPSTIDWS